MHSPRPGDGPSPVRPPRRTDYPDLSLSRPPTLAEARALWPEWTQLPIEHAFGIRVELVDDQGQPLRSGHQEGRHVDR